MAEELVAAPGPQLSQVARVVDTFVAPSKTFEDILRSAQCWLPLVLMGIMVAVWAYAIDKKVGYESVTEAQIQKSSFQADAFNQLPPDQRASRIAVQAKVMRITTYGSIVFVLFGVALEALVLWAIFNFALGASTKYPQVFAVISFAGLPHSLLWVLSAVLLFAGVGLDNFNMQNPVGTNLGFYLQDGPKWLATAGSFVDVLGLWSLVLLILGMATISKKKTSTSAAVIGGLWLFILLVSAGVSAAFS